MLLSGASAPRLPFAAAVRAAAAALALLAGAEPASAQRQRVVPPEPSRTPWISGEALDAMREALQRYQSLAARGTWPVLPDRITLRPGDSDANVVTLRQRLKLTGELAQNVRDDYTFDQNVEEAVRRYQLRNGLEPTGVVYGVTQRLMNVPAATRARQLELNIARMSELLPKIAALPRVIVMNAAGFELQALEQGRVAVTSRTIAGKRATPTPSVSATVQAINLLPYWHVPGTIARAALIPAVRKDPSYLYRERIRVFSTFGGEEVDPATVNWFGAEAERYVFRQDPGPQNALGLLRFDMPNKHIVYMHDTPMKQLFGAYERAFSAGCVRVQNFYQLAEWILAGQDGWTAAGLSAATTSGQQRTIRVKSAVPVHFVYLTAWVEDGAVHFRNDLYNRDNSAFQIAEDASQRVLAPSLAP